MYIPYEKLSQIPILIQFKEKFDKLKISQNLSFINKNKKSVLKRLRAKYTHNKMNVAFYVYDETKWKCQSVYDLLEADKKFSPKILVTKNVVENLHNPSYQRFEEIEKTYKFFKDKNLNVELAYTKGEGFIPFEKYSPDIIIYQHPWYIEKSQGPVVCSKFALTAYIPYYFPTTTAPIDYYLRFHQYIQKYYIFDEITQKTYINKMENKGNNLKVVGQPFLDYFQFNPQQEKEYVIYAPHWTICKQGIAYGTFEWSGKYILEYAKKHPEIKWVFKPHPLLFKAIVEHNLMSINEAAEYYQEWDKIGMKYESGDYLPLFNKSKLLITDCSSFLGEYFMTENPVIQLVSNDATPFNETISQIVQNYYKAKNLSELENLLNQLPQNDTMKNQRQAALENLGYKNNYAAKNILNDLKSTLSEVN